MSDESFLPQNSTTTSSSANATMSSPRSILNDFTPPPILPKQEQGNNNNNAYSDFDDFGDFGSSSNNTSTMNNNSTSNNNNKNNNNNKPVNPMDFAGRVDDEEMTVKNTSTNNNNAFASSRSGTYLVATNNSTSSSSSSSANNSVSSSPSPAAAAGGANWKCKRPECDKVSFISGKSAYCCSGCGDDVNGGACDFCDPAAVPCKNKCGCFAYGWKQPGDPVWQCRQSCTAENPCQKSKTGLPCNSPPNYDRSAYSTTQVPSSSSSSAASPLKEKTTFASGYPTSKTTQQRQQEASSVKPPNYFGQFAPSATATSSSSGNTNNSNNAAAYSPISGFDSLLNVSAIPAPLGTPSNRTPEASPLHLNSHMQQAPQLNLSGSSNNNNANQWQPAVATELELKPPPKPLGNPNSRPMFVPGEQQQQHVSSPHATYSQSEGLPSKTPHPLGDAPSQPILKPVFHQGSQLANITGDKWREWEKKIKQNPWYFFSSDYFENELKISQEVIQLAANEHVDDQPTMCLSDEQLRDYAGISIWSYFRFLKFLILVTLLQFILCLINYIMYAAEHVSVAKSNVTGVRYFYNDFFISNYTSKQRDSWFWTTLVALIVMGLGLLFYRQVWIGCFKFEDWGDVSVADKENEVKQGREKRIKERELVGTTTSSLTSISATSAAAAAAGEGGGEGGGGGGGGGDDEGDWLVRYLPDQSIDVSHFYRSTGEVTGRRLISFLVFAAFVGVQILASMAITRESESQKQEDSAGGAFAIAFVAAALNITFTLISRKLTDFEKFETLGASDRSLVFKLVCFKIANLMSVYGVKHYAPTQCVYDIIGEQFLTLLFVEIIFTTPSHILVAHLLTSNHERYGYLLGSFAGDDRHKAQFELPIEYLTVLYKFLLSCMAMIVFPLSCLLSLAAFVVEFWAARYRMIKLVGRIPKSPENHRNVVTLITFVVICAVIVAPFCGALWILSGETLKLTNTSKHCNNFPN